jgi:hypothetical protein
VKLWLSSFDLTSRDGDGVTRKQVDENLELAYPLTVQKSQETDFDIVFLILPKSASTLFTRLALHRADPIPSEDGAVD